LTWFENGVRLYPNPARQAATLTIQQASPEDVMVQVLSSNGQVVYQQRMVGNRQLTMTIPRMQLSSGIYMLRVTGLQTGFHHVEKFIFE
jgi:hypothetical protein